MSVLVTGLVGYTTIYASDIITHLKQRGATIRFLIKKPAVVFIGEARENQLPISFS
ncbi:hypothetical protein [Chlorobium phaeobacteroides]|uniref:hypothetical protein n=1 Tax=Chlorobium phaeobacteroides TaxID=1096 RepID=UPI00167F5FCB|nr:hypothetical protein [Chlorobium phaeobacteroides]